MVVRCTAIVVVILMVIVVIPVVEVLPDHAQVLLAHRLEALKLEMWEVAAGVT